MRNPFIVTDHPIVGLGQSSTDIHRYEIKITWKPGTPTSIAKDVSRVSGSNRTTFTTTWNSLLNYYRGDKVGKLQAQYIQAIVPYEDGKEMPNMRSEGDRLKASLKSPVSEPTKISTPESRAATAAATAAQTVTVPTTPIPTEPYTSTVPQTPSSTYEAPATGPLGTLKNLDWKVKIGLAAGIAGGIGIAVYLGGKKKR